LEFFSSLLDEESSSLALRIRGWEGSSRSTSELKAQGYSDLIVVEAALLKLDDKQVERMQLEHAHAVQQLARRFEAGYWRSTQLTHYLYKPGLDLTVSG